MGFFSEALGDVARGGAYDNPDIIDNWWQTETGTWTGGYTHRLDGISLLEQRGDIFYQCLLSNVIVQFDV